MDYERFDRWLHSYRYDAWKLYAPDPSDVVDCLKCNGMGYVICFHCEGSGCSFCDGMGEIKCDWCMGQGRYYDE